MSYEFRYLSDRLILITWTGYPKPEEELAFLREHKEQLVKATEPIFYISDLRKERIINMKILSQMSALAKHENYGGGTAFSDDPISQIMVKTFRSFSIEAGTKAAMFKTPEEALEFLENLEDGITQGIDWNDVITAKA